MDVLEAMRIQIRYRFEELCHESQHIPYYFSTIDKPQGFMDPEYENLKDAILQEEGEWEFADGFPTKYVNINAFVITPLIISDFEANHHSIEGIPSIDGEIERIVASVECVFLSIPMCKILSCFAITIETLSAIGIGYDENIEMPTFMFVFFLWGDNPELESQEAREARLAFIQENQQSGPHDTVEVVSNE